MKVLTVGTFEIPHYGHYRLFKRCSAFGSLDVGVNSDEFIQKYKGFKPVMNYEERARTIQDWGFHVWKNDQTDGSIKYCIEKSKCDLLVIGSDWLDSDYFGQIGLDREYLEENEISLMYMPYTKNISTTEIKRRVCESA